MARLIGRLLAGRWARNALALRFPELERFAPLPFAEPPRAARPLVLAPHPDDESIGCGGTLRRLADAGAAVTVAVVTDGSQGSRVVRAMPDGPARERAAAGLAAVRRAEAQAAARVLGVSAVHFLDAPDGRFDPHAGPLGQRLEQLLHEQRPDLVLLPFAADRHRDHWNTNRLLMAVSERPSLNGLRDVPVWAYEVWSPLHANTLVDIGAQLEAKRLAIREYRSQLEQLDYEAAAIGLNRYRAGCGLREGHAEAFYVAPLAAYRRLVRQLSL